MTTSDRRPKLIHVQRPGKAVWGSFEPITPLDGTIANGPLLPVGPPLKRLDVDFEPVASASVEVSLPLVGGADGNRLFEKLKALVDKLNEMESLFDRAGV